LSPQFGNVVLNYWHNFNPFLLSMPSVE